MSSFISTPHILYTLTKVTPTSLLTTYLLPLFINNRATYIYTAKARIKAFEGALNILKDSDRQAFPIIIFNSSVKLLISGGTLIASTSSYISIILILIYFLILGNPST